MLYNFLENMKIKTKVILFLSIPVLTLLFFSISSIHLKYQEHVIAKNSFGFISASFAISDLINELQKERGLSAGYVGSNGKLNKDSLIKQRKLTDEKLKQFTNNIEIGGLQQQFLGLIDISNSMLQKLKIIPTLRTEIDNLNDARFFDGYSEINEMGLSISEYLQALIFNIDLAKQDDAYNSLLWLQERSGQERGLLSGVFSSGQLSAKQFKAFSGYSAEQETHTNHFFTVASAKQQALFRKKMHHPAIAEVRALQVATINKATKNDLLNSLQILIGYGGLIHDFKNYVIRGQDQYTERYEKLYDQATGIINIYRTLPGMSQKEINSLNTIEATFRQYALLLKATKTLIDEGRTVNEIDASVKVDDQPALNAIQYLHKTITGLDTSNWWNTSSIRIQLIKEVSDAIRFEMIAEAKNIETNSMKALQIYTALTLGSLIVTAIFGYLLIRRLGGGIINIATHMTNMQEQGNLDKTLKESGKDEIGDVARAFNSLIAEQQKSKEKLDLAASVFNNTEEAITVTDADQRILMINPAYTKITGYSQEDVIGKNPSVLQSGKHNNSFYKKMWVTLVGHGHWVGEIFNRRKNGEIFPIMLNISAIKNDQGEIVMYIGMFLDITDRKRAEAKQDLLQRQLLQAQKMESLGLLTGGIAHDFNNMLAAILGYTSLAERHLTANNSDQTVKRYIDQVSRAGNRAKSVVAQLLSFSQTGKNEDFESIDVVSLIDESIKMIRPLLPRTIEITQHFEPDEMIIKANAVMIHQVIMNLCINARDAISEHGRIEFGIGKSTLKNQSCSSCHEQLSGDFLEISISDTGKGIANEDFERLFEPFFTTKEMGTEKGTGLGLAMVHGIIHDHGGHIILESTLGQGSKFRLLFTLDSNETSYETQKKGAVKGAELPAPNSTDKGTGYRILCVDDELSIVTFMKELLEINGHSVTIFTESDQALAHFNEDPDHYDLVITDQTMQLLTGAEMSKAMLVTKPDIHIILCSGFSSTIDEQEAKDIGIKAYMYKPLNLKELLDKIHQLMTNTSPI